MDIENELLKAQEKYADKVIRENSTQIKYFVFSVVFDPNTDKIVVWYGLADDPTSSNQHAPLHFIEKHFSLVDNWGDYFDLRAAEDAFNYFKNFKNQQITRKGTGESHIVSDVELHPFKWFNNGQEFIRGYDIRLHLKGSNAFLKSTTIKTIYLYTMKNQLQNLGDNYAGVMRLKNGTRANFGSIRVEDENFIHYSGKGLREMFPQDGKETEQSRALKKLDEQSLMKSQHIMSTPISEIAAIE